MRYGLDTGTQHLGKFGTTSIPVPDTSVSSVIPPKISRLPIYLTEYTLVMTSKWFASMSPHQKLLLLLLLCLLFFILRRMGKNKA